MDENHVFKGVRKKIFKQIQSAGKINFNKLKDTLGLRSNELSYHLNVLVENGVITKGEEYVLSESAKLSYPYLSIITGDERPIFVVCSAALIRDGKIFLQKKPREPEKGKLILFGGKVLEGVSIDESLEAYVQKQAGCSLKNIRLRCVNEFMKKSEDGVFHNVVFFHTAEPVGDMHQDVIERDLESIDDEELFGDNKFLVKEMIWKEKPEVTKDTQVK